MSIELERKELLRRLKKEGKRDMKALARQMRMPYSTILGLAKEATPGTISSWVRVEKYFKRKDAAGTKINQDFITQK